MAAVYARPGDAGSPSMCIALTLIKGFGALGVFPQERLRFHRFIASQKKDAGFLRDL
jgi:hypothetical protein